MRKVILLHVPWHLMQVDAAHWDEIPEALARLIPPGSNLTEPTKNFIAKEMLESAEQGQINLTEILLAQTISQIKQQNFKIIVSNAANLPDNVKNLCHGIISVGKADQEFPRITIKGNGNTADYTKVLLPDDNLPVWRLPIDDNGALHRSVQHAWTAQKERFLQEVAANTKQISEASMAEPLDLSAIELQARYDALIQLKATEIKPLGEQLMGNHLPVATIIETRAKLISSYEQLRDGMKQLAMDARKAGFGIVAAKAAHEVHKAKTSITNRKNAQDAIQKRLAEQKLTGLENALFDQETINHENTNAVQENAGEALLFTSERPILNFAQTTEDDNEQVQTGITGEPIDASAGTALSKAVFQQRYNNLMQFKTTEIAPLSDKLKRSKSLPSATIIETRTKLISSYVRLTAAMKQLSEDTQTAGYDDIATKATQEKNKAKNAISHRKIAQVITAGKRIEVEELIELENELLDLETKQNELASQYPDKLSKPSLVEIYQRLKFQSQIDAFRNKFEKLSSTYKSMGSAEYWKTTQNELETIDHENKNAIKENRGDTLLLTRKGPAPNFAQASEDDTVHLQRTATQTGIQPIIGEPTGTSSSVVPRAIFQQRFDSLMRFKNTEIHPLTVKLRSEMFLSPADKFQIKTKQIGSYIEFSQATRKLSTEARKDGYADIAEKADRETEKANACISHGKAALKSAEKKAAEEKLTELKKELLHLETKQTELASLYAHTLSNPSSEEVALRFNFQSEIDAFKHKFERSAHQYKSAGGAEDWETTRIKIEAIESENKNAMQTNDDYFSQFLPLEERHLSDAPFHQFTQSSVASLRTGKRSAAPATITAGQAAEEDITVAHSPAKKQPRL